MVRDNCGISGNPNPGSSRFNVGNVSWGIEGIAGNDGKETVGMFSDRLGKAGRPITGNSKFNVGRTGSANVGSAGNDGKEIVGMFSARLGISGKHAIMPSLSSLT